MDLSISIVSMNNYSFLSSCLNSIIKYTEGISYEVFVVAYHYETKLLAKLRKKYAWVNFIKSFGVKGYSKNNNIALKKCKGRYCCILNDDVEFIDNSLTKLVKYLSRNPSVGAASPVLLNADGSVQLAVRNKYSIPRVILDPMLRHLGVKAMGMNKTATVEGLNNSQEGIPTAAGSGACFVISRILLEKMNYLDERIFLSPDDVNWSYHISKQRLKIHLITEARVIHYGGAILYSKWISYKPANIVGYIELFKIHYGPMSSLIARFGYIATGLLYSMSWRFVKVFRPGNPNAKVMPRAYWNSVKSLILCDSSQKAFIRWSNK